MKIIKAEPKNFGERIYSLSGISRKTVEEHIKLYQGYVNKYNEIQEKLTGLTDEDYSKANQVYSLIRALKAELSFAWGGIVNHEIYFSHLGGKNSTPSEKLLKQLESDFGSLESYVRDLKATGMAARGWVWTAWNHRENRLFNYLGDSQNTFEIWQATPVLALDTYEHAYFIDYGVNRAGYIEAFLKNLDWKKVEDDYLKISGK